MIAWSWLSTREFGFFGPMRASESKSRDFHLATVLRLTPYRSARTMSFSSLAWIARRIFGFGRAGMGSPSRRSASFSRHPPFPPIALRHPKAQQGRAS
jgi:hypothetical protein